MAVFIRKHNKNLNKKNKKAKILCHDKDFSFLCFLMKMPLIHPHFFYWCDTGKFAVLMA